MESEPLYVPTLGLRHRDYVDGQKNAMRASRGIARSMKIAVEKARRDQVDVAVALEVELTEIRSLLTRKGYRDDEIDAAIARVRAEPRWRERLVSHPSRQR